MRYFLLLLFLQIVFPLFAFVNNPGLSLESKKLSSTESSQDFLYGNILVDLINDVGNPICDGNPSNSISQVITCPSSNYLFESPVFETTYLCKITNTANNNVFLFQMIVNANKIALLAKEEGVTTCEGEWAGESQCVKYWSADQLICEIYFNNTAYGTNGVPKINMCILFNASDCNGKYRINLGQCVEVGFQNQGLLSRDEVEEFTNEMEEENTAIAYPNPFENILYVNVEQLIDDDYLDILVQDSGGRIVKTEIKNSSFIIELDMTNHTRGLYLFSIISQKRIQHFKIIKR